MLPLIKVPLPGTVSVIGPIEAKAVLIALAEQKIRAAAVMLDPMYRAKGEGGRAAYLSETVPLLEAAARVAPNIFLWGFPESVARLVDHWPSTLKLEGWITWFFKNVPSRSKSWRPSQQACLHLRRRDGKLYPEHFYSDRHRKLARENKLEFKMTPFSVIEQPLLSGFIWKSEQTGFRMQKPEAVIEPLLRMTTRPGDLVIDPTCGSGTTGVVALRLGCAAILSDRSALALRISRKRLQPIE
ncbi:MAG: DNA methyltransferase [Panacagrimonas sp.]